MRIYLASRFSRRDELREYATRLDAAGHSITSRWRYGPDKPYEQTSQIDALAHALRDEEDIMRADCVISFTEPRNEGYSSGGRHVEFGIARAAGKINILVGPDENVFHQLAHYTVDTFDEVLELFTAPDETSVRAVSSEKITGYEDEATDEFGLLRHRN